MRLPRCQAFFSVGLLLAGAVALSAAAPGPPGAGGSEFFEQQVRPVLAKRCYACHSHQAPKLQGGLMLDSRSGWLKGGVSGAAVVPGDPDQSLLIRAVRYQGGRVQMPPTGKLPEAEIALLARWVRMGASGPSQEDGAPAARNSIPIEEGRRRWSFQPLRPGALPAVRDERWCRTPVDRYVLAKLEQRGLRPNSQAGRRTLIRRAYFDLTGLPPTPEEVEAFVKDAAPDAYCRVIDRLLASPHYGERWGRHWLDLARFAESHGFEHDYDRPTAYSYRDFVIKALNADMPYDQFVSWQLAGDELAPEDPLAMAATGFLAAGVHSTQITKNQVEKERYDELDDMLATTGTAMLGLTLGCARCHDHKFDPVPTSDYYRLLSTFTTTVRSELDVPLDPKRDREARERFDREHAPLQERLREYEVGHLPGRLREWLDGHTAARFAPANWLVPDLVSYKSQGGASFTVLEDGSLLASGPNPDHDTYTIVVRTNLSGITGVRLEALAHSSLVKGGPGRAANGNFALSDLRVSVSPLPRDAAGQGAPTAAGVEARLVDPVATFEQPGLPVRAAIDDDRKSAWAVDPQFGRDHAAAFRTAAPVGPEGGSLLSFTLRFENNTGHGIGRLLISLALGAGLPDVGGMTRPESVERLLAAGVPLLDAIPAADRATLIAWYRTVDPEWLKLKRIVDEHLAQAPKPQTQKMLIASEGVPAVRLHTQGDDFFPITYFLKRGDPNQKQGEASQGFLQVLTRAPEQEKRWQAAPPPGCRTSYRRHALASWITDANAGAGVLLARVIVNRLWQHHMGRGIVATPSDFGAQGAHPTHPELLDWLARELIRNGWRLKPMHRLMMTSAVYLESAAVDARKERIDPANALCWRHPRRRLEAEIIRDAMLAVSCTLDATMFGPGTLDETQKRRSIYFTVKRSKLVPQLQVFDAPDALQGLGVRSATTVAPQALLLLNNPQVRECARAFARRVLPEVASESAVRRAYMIALSRPPAASELAESLAFIAQQAASYSASGHAAPEEWALADLCQVLMSLNEFVYVD